MTPTQALKHWRSEAPGRHVHWGRQLVAMADGERSLFAAGATTEDAARGVLALWYDAGEQAA